MQVWRGRDCVRAGDTAGHDPRRRAGVSHAKGAAVRTLARTVAAPRSPACFSNLQRVPGGSWGRLVLLLSGDVTHLNPHLMTYP